MSKIFTKILTVINGKDNDESLLDASLNFSKVFDCPLVIGSSAEGFINQGSLIDKKSTESHLNVEKVTLAHISAKDISKKAKEIDADLVVVSHDNDTQQLINSLEVPVLSLLKGFKKRDIKNIVMPLHDDPGTRQKIPMATDIAKVFGAVIHITVVAGNNNEEINKLKTYAHQAQKYTAERRVDTLYHLETGKKVEDETVTYAEKVDADLIIIMNDRDGGGWFSKPLSEKIMMSSNAPVLVVEPKDTTVSYAQL